MFLESLSVKKIQNRLDLDKLMLVDIQSKYEQVFPLAVHGKY